MTALALPSDVEITALAGSRDRSDLARKDLDTLYDEARYHREQAEHHHERMLWHFVELGRRCLEIKARVPHGEFIVTVVDEIGITRQHAQRVMELSRNDTRVCHLPPETSLRAALDLIHEQKLDERAALRGTRQAQAVAFDRADCIIEVADAAMLPLPDEGIDLIVTSPPYGLGIDYADTDDDEGYPTYIEHANYWATEMFRVAAPNGRICLNVPLDVTYGGTKSLYADWVYALLSAGWQYRSTIIWNEGNINKSTARGSVDSPSSPHVIAPVETIIVAHKGEWNLRRIGPHNLTHEQWLEWTNGVWSFPGESRALGHPAPFPEELAHRCIALFSFIGDVVLDPFLGSGTTALVGARLGRKIYGFDHSPRYVDLARARLAQELAA